jgi:integrase
MRIDLGDLVLIMKYSHQPRKGKTIYYRRKVPTDLADHYSSGFIVKSTKTTNERQAAITLININRETEEQWLRLRSGIKTLPRSIDNQAIKRLSEFGIAPSGKGEQSNIDLLLEDIIASLDSATEEKVNIISSQRNLPSEQAKKMIAEALPQVESNIFMRINNLFKYVASDYKPNYLQIKGREDDRKFRNSVNGAFKFLLDHLPDKAPNEYTKNELYKLIDAGLSKGYKTSTIHKHLGLIRAAFNKVSDRFDLNDAKNHCFTNWEIKDLRKDSEERPDFSPEQLTRLRAELSSDTTPVSLIIKIVLDTGMRNAECAGLMKSDIKNISEQIKVIELREHPHRRLKTKNSARYVPLVGAALEAVNQAIKLDTSSQYLFPKYISKTTSKVSSDNASAACNKRLKSILGSDSPTLHSLRHTMNTRLKDSQCPDSLREELLGWSNHATSAGYGQATDIGNKHDYLMSSLDWSRSSIYI